MAQNEEINAVQDTALFVDAAHGVLANDTNDPDEKLDLPQVQLLRTSKGGQIYFETDGSYTYISAPGFSGTDTVEYTTENFGTGTLTINVTATALLPFVSIGTQLSERLPIIHGFGQVGNGIATMAFNPIPLSEGGYVVTVSYLDQAFGSLRQLWTYDADHKLLNVFDPGQPVASGFTVVALAGGGYALAYGLRTIVPDPDDPPDGTLLIETNYVHVFDAAGNSVSGPTLSDVPGDRDVISGLAALPDGGFVLLQATIDPAPQLYAQSFSAAGVPESQKYAVGGDTETRNPFVLPNGLIVTSRIENGNELYLQRYDTQGTPIGAEIHPLGGPDEILSTIRVKPLAGGGFAVTWAANYEIPNPDDPDEPGEEGVKLYAQVVDANGNLVGTSNERDFEFSPIFGAPFGTITALANGGFVVHARGTEVGGQIVDVVQTYDANGNPIGAQIEFISQTLFGTTRALVYGLPEGGFAIGLQSANPEDHDDLLIYDNNGSLVGEVRMHDLGDGTGASSFNLTNLVNGDTLIVGATFSDTGQNDNWAQTIRFDTPTPVVEGNQTAGANPYSAVVLPVRVSIPADADGSEVVESLLVSGVPAGWTLSYPNATATLNADVWTITGPGIAQGGAIDLRLIAPAGTPASGMISVVAHTVDTDNGSRNQSFPASFDFANLPPLNPPVITSNGGGSVAAVQVAENLAAVTTVVATTDLDDTPFYAIVGGPDAMLFAIDAATGALTFKTAPDFEAPEDAGDDNTYEVIVAASDGILTNTQTILVTVSDVDGVKIEGTKGKDKVTATKTVDGEPLPTGEEDRIDGKGGNDKLFALGGNDVITGGRGRDVLKGGAGDDTLTGGGGRDKYVGGPGIDTFMFDSKVTPRSIFDYLSMADVKRWVDTIVDYEKDEKIILDSKVFKGLSKGRLDADQFNVGGHAETFTHRIIYEKSAGLLIYDRNGWASAGDGVIAKIGKHLDHLSAEDFIVI